MPKTTEELLILLPHPSFDMLITHHAIQCK